MSENLPIVFSRHALIKLEQRGLTKEMVTNTIEDPSYLVTAGEHMHAFRKFGTLYLKVIFARTEKSIIIITQHFIKKLP